MSLITNTACITKCSKIKMSRFLILMEQGRQTERLRRTLTPAGFITHGD